MANRQSQRKPPTDMTGRKQQELQEQHAAELQAREGEIALMNAATAVALEDGVFDPSSGRQIDGLSPEEIAEGVVFVDDADAVQDLTQGGNGVGPAPVVEVQPEMVTVGGGDKVIRVNTKLEDVTIGQGNHYTFEEGKRYKVPAHVAAHLEEKGYIWH